MKFFRQIFPLLLFLVLPGYRSFAQSKTIDSLRNILKTEPNDTGRVINLNLLAACLAENKPDSTITLALQADTLAQKLGWKKGLARASFNIGVGYCNLNDYPKALDYYQKALKLNEELNNKRGQATDYGSIGIIYANTGEADNALGFYLKALKMDEDIGNKKDQANFLGDIGNVYDVHGNYSKALEYDLKALKMDEDLGYKEGQANNLGNLGNLYGQQYNWTKAMEYYKKSLQLFEAVGNKHGEAFDLGNLGLCYRQVGKVQEAEKYLKVAITTDSAIGEKFFLNQYEERLSELYEATGRYKLALFWYKKGIATHDSLFNIDKDKALMRKEMVFRFQQQEDSAKAVQVRIDAVHSEEVKRQNTIIYAVSAGLILVLLLALSILRSLQQNRKKTQIIAAQKADVEKKNILIEEKNKDILDSITYAKRLQDAILPPLSLIKKYFPESFLIYKPKDIVAGDFYWMERAGDNILVAAADCTGHGVPGALVSVVCSNALNRTVKEFHITEPGKILDKVRELVLETFEKSEGNIQDGMDISLCCINTDTKEAQWSGAYNSLWYFRNGEVTEVPADKQPIGKTDKPEPFNTHNLNLQKGDTLYLFTDGYADQFGGPKGKKFKYKQMQELLLANAGKSMDEQKKILEDALNEWKGSLEQVDDVLVIGIRV